MSSRIFLLTISLLFTMGDPPDAGSTADVMEADTTAPVVVSDAPAINKCRIQMQRTQKKADAFTQNLEKILRKLQKRKARAEARAKAKAEAEK
jgi:hypothetical protein